jgi:dTDP-4-amino-4,6-dideoxygalactose transaminase
MPGFAFAEFIRAIFGKRKPGLLVGVHYRPHWLGKGIPNKPANKRFFVFVKLMDKLINKKETPFNSTLWRKWFWNGQIKKLFDEINGDKNIRVVIVGPPHLASFKEKSGLNKCSFFEVDRHNAAGFVDSYYEKIKKEHAGYLANNEYVVYFGGAGVCTQILFSRLQGELVDAAMIDVGRAMDVYYFYESFEHFGYGDKTWSRGSWLTLSPPKWLEPEGFKDRLPKTSLRALIKKERARLRRGIDVEVPFCKPHIPNMFNYKTYINRACSTGHLTNNGPLLEELQNRLSRHLGVKNLLLVSNGTAALEVAYKALELSGEVITTPFSFAATPNSMLWVGLKPKFADIDIGTLNIDPDRISELINENTSAIAGVHTFGSACEIERIQEIADKNSLKVIYDAAHCFGTKYKGQSILSFGDISTFSMHATKIFHTIEGGGLVIKDDALYELAKKIINFGISDGKPSCIGINAKMNEFSAAMGLCMLDDIQKVATNRMHAYFLYKEKLSDKLVFQEFNQNCSRNNSFFPIIFETEEKMLKTKKILEDAGVGSRRYFYPSLDTLPYIKEHIGLGNICKNSFDISSRILCLPLHSQMIYSQVLKVSKLVNSSLD